MSKTKHSILFLFIFLLGAFFRLYGLNWDQGQHLHPDERFLTMVAGAMQWPTSFSEYLDTNVSKLNPHNVGHTFYVYGTLPIIFVKFVAETLGMGDYGGLTLAGRALSAIVDLGTMALVFLITKHIVRQNSHFSSHISRFAPYAAMFLYATCALAIQLSHFYAVDPYLTFFQTLAMYLAIRGSFGIRLGIALGLAFASKISAFLIVPVVSIAWIATWIKTKRKGRFLFTALAPLIAFLITIRLALPYLFTGSLVPAAINEKILNNWQQLASFNTGDGGFPPSVQWVHTKPFLFPFLNMAFFGFGLPHMTIILVSTTLLLLKKRSMQIVILLIATGTLWLYQGGQFVKALRYFYPVYPLLTVLAGLGATYLFERISKKLPHFSLYISLFALFALLLLWPLAFTAIYRQPHSRITASWWMYANIPEGSSLATEHWDDGLPISFPGATNDRYTYIETPVYGADTPNKWAEIARKLEGADYVVLTSNRALGALTSLPDKYPITTRYYQALLDGTLGFIHVAQFTSRPYLPIPFMPPVCIVPPMLSYSRITESTDDCNEPGITFVDDYSDETWTVYDHPKVIIFKKIQPVDYRSMLGV